MTSGAPIQMKSARTHWTVPWDLSSTVNLLAIYSRCWVVKRTGPPLRIRTVTRSADRKQTPDVGTIRYAMDSCRGRMDGRTGGLSARDVFCAVVKCKVDVVNSCSLVLRYQSKRSFPFMGWCAKKTVLNWVRFSLGESAGALNGEALRFFWAKKMNNF